MLNNEIQAIECGNTYTLKSPNADTVRLTIDDSNPTETFVSISCHRTSCHFVANLSNHGAIPYLSKASVEKLLDLLFPSHFLWEFDTEKGTQKANELVEEMMSGATTDASEIEEFWDENQYSLSQAKTRDEFAAWVSKHIADYDLYDALNVMTYRRHTPEASLIGEVAIPLIKQAISSGLITA